MTDPGLDAALTDAERATAYAQDAKTRGDAEAQRFWAHLALLRTAWAALLAVGGNPA